MGQIQIHRKAASRPDVLRHESHRVTRTPPRPEAKAACTEPRVKDRPEDLRDRLLDHAIQHRRDTQQSDTTVGLCHLHTSHRRGFICPLLQRATQLRPVRAELLRELVDGEAIDARRSVVGPHLLPRPAQVVLFQDRGQQVALCFRVLSVAPRLRYAGRRISAGRAGGPGRFVSVRAFATSEASGHFHRAARRTVAVTSGSCHVATTPSADSCVFARGVAAASAGRPCVPRATPVGSQAGCRSEAHVMRGRKEAFPAPSIPRFFIVRKLW